MSRELVGLLDGIAQDLESRGLAKQAAALDVVSNTLEASGSWMDDDDRPSVRTTGPVMGKEVTMTHNILFNDAAKKFFERPPFSQGELQNFFDKAQSMLEAGDLFITPIEVLEAMNVRK